MGTKSCEFWSSSDTFGFLQEEEELPGFLNVLKGDADDGAPFSEDGALSAVGGGGCFFVGVLRLRKLPNVVTGGGCCCCCCGGAEESSEDNVPCDQPVGAQVSFGYCGRHSTFFNLVRVDKCQEIRRRSSYSHGYLNICKWL